MTAAKSTFRRRRSGGSSIVIPKFVALWFAGERAFTFHAYGVGSVRLRELWAAWEARNPGAVPPPDFERCARNGDSIRRLQHRQHESSGS